MILILCKIDLTAGNCYNFKNRMKKVFRDLFRVLLKNNFFWFLCQPIIKLSEFLKYQRNYYSIVEEKKQVLKEFESIKNILGTPIVKHGPFKGLIYPDFISHGSTIFPKILGCYEKELHEIISHIGEKKYSEIIDIGSAEGYYAVGLAINMPNAKVYAFDIDEEARLFCEKMSDLNLVSNRVIIGRECNNNTLANFSFSDKGLIICDCEGYEKELFTLENVKNLSNCDLIIETHDFIDLTISKHIETVFYKTHNIKIIESIDDNIKAKTYTYPETSNLNLLTKKRIFSEGRPAIMEWYYLEAKSNFNN